MSNKDDLRTQRNGTVINTTSKAQEKRLGNSLPLLCKQLSSKYGVQLKHESQWLLRDVVGKLRHWRSDCTDCAGELEGFDNFVVVTQAGQCVTPATAGWVHPFPD
jgi:hypothetical protein